MKILIYSITLLAISSFAAPTKSVVKQQKKIAHQAKQALMPLKKGLMKALKSSIKTKGAVASISMCKTKAPSITKSAQQKNFELGRTSNKLRNLSNAPKTWIQPYLKKYQNSKAGDLPSHQLVALKDNRFGYLEPIYLKPLCLTCHGENLSPKVKNKLVALYPKDQATGYKLGEFRGFFWVELNSNINSNK